MDEQREWLGATEISKRLNKPLRTVQDWLANRRDIFPNARKDGPGQTSPWVTHVNDVVAYEKAFSKENWEVKPSPLVEK